MRTDVRFHCFFIQSGKVLFFMSAHFLIDVYLSISARIVRLTSDDTKRKIVIFCFSKHVYCIFTALLLNIRLFYLFPCVCRCLCRLQYNFAPSSPSRYSARHSRSLFLRLICDTDGILPDAQTMGPAGARPIANRLWGFVKIGLPQLRSVYSVCSSLCARWLFGLPRNSS